MLASYRVADPKDPAKRPPASDPAGGKGRIEPEDGGIVIRAKRPADARRHSDFMSRIDETDLRRFAPSLEPDGAHSWSGRCDYPEMAFVAVRERGASAGEIVGEIRAYHYPGTPTAEVGIIVRTDMKGRGIGRALMEAMVGYAKDERLELLARIAAGNAPMLGLARRVGMEVEHRPGTPVAVAHMRRAGDRT